MTAAQPSELHPSLARQLAALGVNWSDGPTALGSRSVQELLAVVDLAYRDADHTRQLLERIIEHSPSEMQVKFTEQLTLTELRLSYERDRFQAVFEGVSSGLLVVNGTGQITAANPEAARVLGPLHTLIGSPLDSVLRVRSSSNETRPLIDLSVLNNVAHRQRWHFSNVTLSPLGMAMFPADCVIVPFRPGESRAGAVVFISDNTAREASQADLQWQATHDTLTGLANRPVLLDRLQHALILAERNGIWPALLFLDLDRFKSINDRYGHAAGDRLLVLMARRIEAAIRPADTVVRLGGDEFVVLCEAMDDADVAEQIAERVVSALAEPFDLDDHAVIVSASIGIVHAHGVGLRADDVIRDADLAMYRAKENGRNRIEVFDRDLRQESRRRVVIERALRGAIDQGAISIAYQPIFETETGRLVAFEALARWQDADLGQVDSFEFISLAEETGLIVPLGAQLLDAACSDALRWSTVAQRQIGLHVNVSARQLNSAMLLPNLSEVLANFALPAEALTLEIAESVVIDNPDRAVERLRAVRDLGVKVAIDDFGTGRSSLAFLRHLPLTMVKIDRVLVGGMAKSKDELQVMRAIIELAAGLNFSVVAEGVEEADDLAALRSLGCQYAQGFLLASPMTPDDALDLARRWASPAQTSLQPPSGVRKASVKTG